MNSVGQDIAFDVIVGMFIGVIVALILVANRSTPDNVLIKNNVAKWTINEQTGVKKFEVFVNTNKW